MRRIASALSFVFLALLAAAGHGATPVASRPALLAAARDVAGGTAWDGVAVLQAEGQVHSSGLSGPWTRVDDLKTGRWATHEDFGAFRFAEGHDGRRHWRQDPSGAVHSLNAAFSRAATVTDAWLARRGWLRANAAGAHLGAVQTRSDEGQSFDVIEATPRGGQPVELWFDAEHRLVRTVRTMPISVQTVRYADHRRVQGVVLPFAIETRDSGSSDVERVQVAGWSVSARAPRGAFDAPQPPDDTTLAGETTVPLEIDGLVTVEARLNGRPFHFILDTGGHNIITPEVAAALGLQGVGAGASGGAGAGELPQQYTRIATLQIGAATLRDQSFYVMPLQYGTVERGPREPLAGLIGLELFERFAARIDYPAKTLTLRTLAGHRHHGAGVAVPIVFDDDMPLLQGRIAGQPGLIALDTGNAGTTVVQAVWARVHGLADRLKRGLETVSYGAGGASRNWASRAGDVEIGGIALRNPIVRYAEDSAGAFSSRTEAANIGTDLLSHFVIDVDYARGVIWFEHRPGVPEQPFNRSGLRAIKEEPGAFAVALVLPDSPAARAGVAQGDRIVAVDGVAADRLSGRDLAHKLIQAVGTPVKLKLLRGTEAREAVITLAEMLP
jgi:predicted aspartyl protease